MSKHTNTIGVFVPGALFASVGFVKALCYLVASGVSNSLYTATMHFMKGFTFMCAAVLLLIPSGIIGYVCCPVVV